jgi:hypothetical protein
MIDLFVDARRQRRKRPQDWMLAVGYYMSVIFWILAFSLRDPDGLPGLARRGGGVAAFAFLMQEMEKIPNPDHGAGS